MSRAPRAAIGIKSKTGRAIAVALRGPRSNPEFVLREEIALSDKRRPATQQPYHEVMELPWPDALIAVTPSIDAIREIAIRSLSDLISDLKARGVEVAEIGVVGPPDRLLEKIGNPHIRAHAAEGVLFRRVIEEAATAVGIRSRSVRDPAAEVTASAREIKAVLARLGRAAGAPWRSDEKSAATAAWLAL